MKKNPTLLLAFCLISPVLAGRVCAQTGDPDPNFNPPTLSLSASTPTVYALGEQNGGKILVAGSFDAANGSPSGNIIRLLPSGAIDPSFTPLSGANGTIRCILMDSAQRIWIGGDFTNYDGVERNRIARLNENGTLDATTTTMIGSGFDGPVHALAFSSPNPSAIYVGGNFGSFNGNTRQNLAAVAILGSSPSFSAPVVNGPVYALKSISGSGFNSVLVIGGNFTSVSKSPRNYLATLTTSGALTTFNSTAGSGPDGPVYSLDWVGSPAASTEFWVGGSFANFNQQPRTNLALISVPSSPSTGELSTKTTPAMDGAVRAFAPVVSGPNPHPMAVGGDFTTIQGTSRNRIGGIRRQGGDGNWINDTTYHASSGADGTVQALLRTVEGKMVVGGSFQNLGGQSRSGIARLLGSPGLNPPGAATSLTAEAVSSSEIIALWGASSTSFANSYRLESSPDGVSNWTTLATNTVSPRRVLVEGLQPGVTRHLRMVSVNSNGETPSPIVVETQTPAAPWTGAGSADLSVGPIDVDAGHRPTLLPDGKVLVIDESTLKKYLPNGTPDPSYQPPAISFSGGGVAATAVDAAGRFYLGGEHSDPFQRGIKRILANGTLDPTYNTPANLNRPLEIGLQHSGKLVVCVDTPNSSNGFSGDLMRFHTDGSLDTSFATLAKNVGGLLVLPDDRILIWGNSDLKPDGVTTRPSALLTPEGLVDPSYTGTLGRFNDAIRLQSGKFIIAGSFRVARLNADGSEDSSFTSLETTSSSITRVVEQPDGKLLVSGGFNTIDGHLYFGIVRLEENGAIDTSFKPGSALYDPRFAVDVDHALMPDLRILATGNFPDYAGAPMKNLAIIKGDTPPATASATPVIAATAAPNGGTRISWTRPERVFDYLLERSTNGTSGWVPVAFHNHAVDSLVMPYPGDGLPSFYRLSARNVAGATLSNVVQGADSYATWKSNFALPPDADADSDGDHDGVPLLVEYALGMNPGVADPSLLPVGVVSGDSLSISFIRHRGDLNYIPEWSDDLDEWSEEGIVISGSNPVSASIAREDARKRFLRLRVVERAN